MKGRFEYTVEPKYDGLAIELTYRDGVLYKASTRGDGYEGEELKASRTAPLVEADHGRIETRTATVSTEIGWLQKQHQWPGLKAIGKVERVRETAEKTTTETAYYLLSSKLTPERFNEVVRQHWSIENSLHWRLDVVMNEDQDRTRAGNGAHNLAVLRHMAINAMPKKVQTDRKTRWCVNISAYLSLKMLSSNSTMMRWKQLPNSRCNAKSARADCA